MSGVSLAHAHAPFILVVDIGTSSLRAMVYDATARNVSGLVARRMYQPDTTEDGGSTLDARAMWGALVSVLDEIVSLIGDKIEIAAVAASSLASNVLVLGANNEPLSPAFLYADTRNADGVRELRAKYDWSPMYARTGCPLHTAYLPARFVFLRETEPDIFGHAARFVSLHEFFLGRLFGRASVCHSLAAWTGMLNHATGDWDDEILKIAGVEREQLSPVSSVSSGLVGLRAEYAARWQGLAKAPWFPALGDGAAANIGSGCADETRVAITIGTSGAMRAVMPAQEGLGKLPPGLWLYRVDERDGLMGGSLTDGGSILHYLSNLLKMPKREELERQVEAMTPDTHGLTFLPFFAGERSPGYHGSARATLTGWNLHTSAADVWRAALEAVGLRMAAIYDLLKTPLPPTREVVASGAALLHTRGWMQMLADILGAPVTASEEEEASARGAAMVTLRALGVIETFDQVPTALGETYTPRPEHFEIYQRARKRHESLYDLMLGRGD